MYILRRKLSKVSSCANLPLAINCKLPSMLEGSVSRVTDVAEVAWIPGLSKADDPSSCIDKDRSDTGRWDVTTTGSIRVRWCIHRELTGHGTWLRGEAFDWVIFAASVSEGCNNASDRIERKRRYTDREG